MAGSMIGNFSSCATRLSTAIVTGGSITWGSSTPQTGRRMQETNVTMSMADVSALEDSTVKNQPVKLSGRVTLEFLMASSGPRFSGKEGYALEATLKQSGTDTGQVYAGVISEVSTSNPDGAPSTERVTIVLGVNT